MGQSAGARKKSERRLAKMSDGTEAELYRSPPETVCDVQRYPVPFDDEGSARYYWVQWIYRKRVVHFSIEIQVREKDGWRTLYRIDTSHGTVHEHRYWTATGEDRRVIETIPIVGSWDFVSKWFEEAMEMCEEAWPDRIKEWMK